MVCQGGERVARSSLPAAVLRFPPDVEGNVLVLDHVPEDGLAFDEHMSVNERSLVLVQGMGSANTISFIYAADDQG